MYKFVIKFLFEYGVLRRKNTIEDLKKIIQSQGFEIIVFDPKNFPLDNEQLSVYSKYHDCFTYVGPGGEGKFVFVNKNISDRDKVYLLLHEEAHIYQEHFTGMIGIVHLTDVQLENKANKFASAIFKISRFVHNLQFYCLIAIALLALALIFHLQENNTDTHTYITDDVGSYTIADTDTVYFTEEGEVYHIYKDCYHLSNTRRILSCTLDQCCKPRCCETCLKRNIR